MDRNEKSIADLKASAAPTAFEYSAGCPQTSLTASEPTFPEMQSPYILSCRFFLLNSFICASKRVLSQNNHYCKLKFPDQHQSMSTRAGLPHNSLHHRPNCQQLVRASEKPISTKSGLASLADTRPSASRSNVTSPQYLKAGSCSCQDVPPDISLLQPSSKPQSSNQPSISNASSDPAPQASATALCTDDAKDRLCSTFQVLNESSRTKQDFFRFPI